MEHYTEDNLLLEVINLKTYFPVKKGILGFQKEYVKAVDDVTLSIKYGETLGIVGESGSGKSTLGKSIMRLVKPTSGKIKIRGKEITSLSKKEMFPIRKDVQIVFQDPYSSLNPRFTVGKIVSEGMHLHNICKETETQEKLIKIFEKVGLREFHIDNYPHEFSGGQRQRIGIARALALNPKLIIADEPVSALDVSVQAQVINLFMDLQEEFELSYMFIAHDLSVIAQICSKIGVMYLGNIVEITDRETLFKNPQHPYTKALLSSIPMHNPQSKKKQHQLIKGDIPSPTNPPSGCKFHTRCPFVKKICRLEKPVLKQLEKDHEVACHLV
jgi:oligopeptide/dipeptide ABC transporter ATP-binding protein